MELPKSKLVKRQKRKCERTIRDERLKVTIRFDDDCNNKHNSFAITAELWERQTENHNFNPVSYGCQHEEVIRFFPEFEHLIKWHLCQTDGPMYYLANTLYHAGDRDCWGKRKGEPKSFSTAILFGDFPIAYQLEPGFASWLGTLIDFDGLIIEAVPHEKEPGGYAFEPKYTFTPFGDSIWHKCPFNTKAEAEEFLEALQNWDPKFIELPTAWGEGKEPNLKAARSSAIWPDATLEQLQDEDLLKARLPALMEEFKAVVESLGMIY